MLTFQAAPAMPIAASSIRLLRVALVGVCLAATPGDAGAEAVADFYRGKTITLSVGYSSGGAYDGVARILARHMRPYIPGNPAIIVKNAPGAGTLSLTNQLYNVAARDGTQFGIIARGMAMEPLIGQSNTKFDSTKFTWIGSAANEVSMCVTLEGSAVKTWDDALIKPFTVAGNGSGSDPDVFANLLRSLFGVKNRLISGYPGTAEISLAMERGEVDGRCGWSWTSIKAEKAAWLAEKKLNLILQLALEKARDLPNVPLIVDKAQTEAQRQILKLIFSRQTMGRPFVAPPAIPADRRDALRAAFDQTMKDPGFLTDAEKSRIEINPVAGVAIDDLVKDLYRTPPGVVAEARKAVESAR
jgi:tripartite-type tricarboxylate transporter receptor subunit TctC